MLIAQDMNFKILYRFYHILNNAPTYFCIFIVQKYS